MNNNKDKSGSDNNTHKKSREVIETAMELKALSDVWRVQHPESRKYTWGLTNRNSIYERLDYFLVSDQLLGNVTYSDILPAYLTDHALPYIRYKTAKQKRGPGFWKLNTSLLQDENYTEEASRKIVEIMEKEDYNSTTQQWEMVKLESRGLRVFHSILYKKEKE